MANHRANVENIANVVEYIKNVDPEQFVNITDEVFEEMEINFEKIMDQDSYKEVLSDDTSYATDSSKHDTDHTEKFVPSLEICALNGRTKHCMIQCYYTTGETADMQAKFIYPKNNQENCEIYYSNADNNINDKEDVMSKSDDGETAIEENITTYNSFQNEARNKVEEKNQEEGSRTSMVNSTPMDCEEGSNQTYLRNTTQSYLQKLKGKDTLTSKEIKFSRIGISTDDNNEISHVTLEELIKGIQLRNSNIKSPYNCKKKNNPSSKILASTRVQSQEIIEKFIRKRKSKREKRADKDNVPLECFTLSEEPNKNRLTGIVKLLRLEHLNAQEEQSVINLIYSSQDRFHVPGERLTATNVLQHQIPTTDDRPINTR
ncbi:hypothetical protein ALC56_02305 [Trachymyrmex septentrionalis]|uniref:Uncharacterized protein n=1 Tax=Trachymyrmex septentrionalis TaxID=34720 RepID=A0A151K186_9HYME|nr:hypothetical protein ALC56_02305 [Trachymyrmex septentrionalis]